MDGLEKIEDIPIDNNGVFSFGTHQLRQNLIDANAAGGGIISHGAGQNGFVDITSPVNVLLNITSRGTERIITFESQLMFANSTKFPLTIFFMFNEEKENHGKQPRQLTQSIQPNDVFRAPLIWFTAQNMQIDVYLIRKSIHYEEASQIDSSKPIRPNFEDDL